MVVLLPDDTLGFRTDDVTGEVGVDEGVDEAAVLGAATTGAAGDDDDDDEGSSGDGDCWACCCCLDDVRSGGIEFREVRLREEGRARETESGKDGGEGGKGRSR